MTATDSARRNRGGRPPIGPQVNIAISPATVARIDAAARTTGRTGADITLVAATKMNDAARVREAYDIRATAARLDTLYAALAAPRLPA